MAVEPDLLAGGRPDLRAGAGAECPVDAVTIVPQTSKHCRLSVTLVIVELPATTVASRTWAVDWVTAADRQGPGAGQVQVEDFRCRCRDRLTRGAGVGRDGAVLLDVIPGRDGDVELVELGTSCSVTQRPPTATVPSRVVQLLLSGVDQPVSPRAGWASLAFAV